jgi:hypothetical protein
VYDQLNTPASTSDTRFLAAGLFNRYCLLLGSEDDDEAGAENSFSEAEEEEESLLLWDLGLASLALSVKVGSILLQNVFKNTDMLTAYSYCVIPCRPCTLYITRTF